jgi:membrane associated rhomboid family serine protease
MDLLKEFRQFFRQGSALIQLLIINVAVFLILKLLRVFFFLFQQDNLEQLVLGFLALPAEPAAILRKPWTVVTYMFLHYDFLHILFNMLWLYWFGKIFLEYLNSRKLYAVYLLGGLTGGLVYVLAYNIFPAFSESLNESVALGASAAVLAIVMAISFHVPNYKLYLMFIGPVKLKYIALATILIDILSIPSSNAGGHLAHLGGAIFGFGFAMSLNQEKNTSGGFNRIMESLRARFRRKPKMRVEYTRTGRTETDMEYKARKAEEQKEIDRILDKISKGGYGALSKEEKDLLFRSSRK